MVASTFGWLDHDDGERRRMMEVIDLFREKGTLDELGLGTIRNTYANHFFPGTSTIQTRARYFLFIPWFYRQIENERVSSKHAGGRARELQWHLVQSLRSGGGQSNAGLIGIDAGENLQRLPSSIYWQGLRRWGIRLFDGSVEQYHASLDGWYREERVARSSDGGELIAMAHRNWHGSLPPCPANLLDSTSFSLSLNEAEFLYERIRQSCGASLLAACLTPRVTRIGRARAPWDLGGLDSLQDDLRQDIADARRYSLVMEGAVLLYNRMLAELAADRGASSGLNLVDRYGHDLNRWADEMTSSQAELTTWDRPSFWLRIRNMNPGISPGAVQFSEAWLQRAILEPRSLISDDYVRLLINRRERRLKGGLARLSNPRALEKWSGESGVGRLTYRWSSAQRIVLDILGGLRQRTEVV